MTLSGLISWNFRHFRRSYGPYIFAPGNVKIIPSFEIVKLQLIGKKMSLFSQSDAIFSVTTPTVPCCSCPKKTLINYRNFTRIHVGFLLHSISSVLEGKYRRKLDKFCNTVDFVSVTQFRHFRNENALPVKVRTVSQLNDHVTWSWRSVRFLSRHFVIIFSSLVV